MYQKNLVEISLCYSLGLQAVRNTWWLLQGHILLGKHSLKKQTFHLDRVEKNSLPTPLVSCAFLYVRHTKEVSRKCSLPPSYT